MENGNVNGGLEFQESSFWSNYSSLKEIVKALKRKSTPLELYDPLRICGEIEKILDSDEEERPSFLRNKIRKLNAGSELCKEICALQRHFSCLEIDRAVSEVLEKDKHEKIADRIISRRTLEERREKYFLKQALDTIRNSVGDETDEEEEAVPEVQATDKQPHQEDTNLPELVDATSPKLDVTRPETARGSENLDQLRMSKMSVGTRKLTEIPDPPLDITIPEEEQRQSVEDSHLNIDLKEFEDILEMLDKIDEPPRQGISGEPDVPQPVTMHMNGIKDVVQNLQENDDVTSDLESLAPVIPPPKRRRRVRPGFDQTVIIPNYSERARRLNESTVVERVQVYEGPPSIIQSFKIRHVLQTPAVNNGLSRTVRSSALERLYTRHQKTEKMPPETNADFSMKRSAVHATIVHEDSRQPSRAEARKSNVFDISTVQANIAETAVSRVRPEAEIEEQLERLVGTPVSKILQMDVVPPAVPVGSSDPWLPARSTRMRNLRGRSLEPPIAEPWFKPIEQTPPDDKWREFECVRTRLEEVWRDNSFEKGATLREVLHREGEWRKENMFTALRVVDKMALKREVVLESDGENVVVYPFQYPYVTDKQFSLRSEPSKY